MIANRYFAVMKLSKMDTFTAGGHPVSFEDKNLVGFICVFKTREAAEAWAGCPEHVREITTEPVG